ncbi:sulfate/molybdate ABC transporter ATP-binding protein [Anaerotruncus rubiinfantis]|uniref:sulfate/molybdate ABC transporter ATP-binding protein n=1 Tax=Anaerotruncus rubiinfantis TaxID=1720200 RepID=UPI00082FE1B4|nr:ATP-binding cassette domain-containing protein [Anaerotruncus rubiinfantis]
MSLFAEIYKQLGSFTLDIKLEAENEVLGLLGASGCGKSMTLRCIAGIVKPDHGRIVLNGRVLFDSEERINLSPQQRGVGLMFQSYALFPNMTVAQNIAAGVKDKEKQPELVHKFCSLLQLDGMENRLPHQLSGGQQQRVALARMMASEPGLLMLDEPFSALDGQLRHTIEPEFAAALDAFEGAVLYVSHSISEIYRYCGRTAVMTDGRVVECAPTGQLFAQPSFVETARLLCCKNISPLTEIAGEYATASAWNMRLRFARPLDGCCQAGIHDDDLYFCDKAGENCFAAVVEQVYDRPRKAVVQVRLPGAREPLRVSCGRETAGRVSKMGTVYVCFPMEKLLPLREKER